VEERERDREEEENTNYYQEKSREHKIVIEWRGNA